MIQLNIESLFIFLCVFSSVLVQFCYPMQFTLELFNILLYYKVRLSATDLGGLLEKDIFDIIGVDYHGN